LFSLHVHHSDWFVHDDMWSQLMDVYYNYFHK
jgi:hypothetical protein